MLINLMINTNILQYFHYLYILNIIIIMGKIHLSQIYYINNNLEQNLKDFLIIIIIIFLNFYDNNLIK
jgi:hypothetical protein